MLARRTSGANSGVTWSRAVLWLGVAVALSVLALWAWSARRTSTVDSERGGDSLDAFERAGVTELAKGQRGPGLRLRPLSGGAAADLAAFRDKLVILNFWATWCTPCTQEMPALESLWAEYRSRGLVVLGIAEDRDAPHRVLAPHVARLGLTFPVLVDPEQRASEAWRVTGLPTTFLIRPGGEVAGMAVGAREWTGDAMRALVEHLLPAEPGGDRDARRGLPVREPRAIAEKSRHHTRRGTLTE